MTDFGSRHKTSHQDGGGDEIDCTGLAGRADYVDRGDPAAYDFTKNDFTTDGTWQDLDLSTIVPAGAKAVHVLVVQSDDAAFSTFYMREKGNSNTYNKDALVTQVANVSIAASFLVTCDADRTVQYQAANLSWTALSMVVRGWII